MKSNFIMTVFVFFAGVLSCVLLQSLIFPKQYYAAILPDGAVFDGQLVDGVIQGHGKIKWDDKTSYEGEFVDGLFDGNGVLNDLHQVKYVGDFKRGKFSGKGEIFFSDYATYFGDVLNYEMHGKGIYRQGENTYSGSFENGKLIDGDFVSADGERYQGAFSDWLYHGDGLLMNALGDKYSGQFEFGSLHGQGEHVTKDGAHYVGIFDYGTYHGVGRLVNADGSIYEGEFRYGEFHGNGLLTQSLAEGDTIIKGKWRYGKLIARDDGVPIISAESLNEKALYNQLALLHRDWQSVEESDADKIDMYFLGIAGDGGQSVFRREVEYIKTLFDQKFHTQARSSLLINSRQSVEEIPLATETSIKQSLDNFSKKWM